MQDIVFTCAICSGMFSSEQWSRIAIKEIDMSFLEVNEELKKLCFEIDFKYGHPHIDKSNCKILLDRNGFIKQNANIDSETPFDLRVCYECK